MRVQRAALFSAGLFFAGCAFALAQPEGSAPKPAAEKICLQSNRVWGFDVVDERTLKITDRTYKRYIIHMTSGCVGLTPAAINIALRTKTALGCLEHGDRVSFNSPGLGRLSCLVTTVEADRPAPQKEGD